MRASFFILCLCCASAVFASHVEYTLNANHVIRSSQFADEIIDDFALCIRGFNSVNSPIQGVGEYDDHVGNIKAIRFIDTGTQQTLAQLLPDLGANSLAHAINSSKRAVGYVADPNRTTNVPQRDSEGIIEADGQGNIIPNIRNIHTPVYWNSTPDPDQLNNWFNELVLLPHLHALGDGYAKDINDSGLIIINGTTDQTYNATDFASNINTHSVVNYTAPQLRAYVYNNGGTQILSGLAGANIVEAMDINETGQVVGYSDTTDLVTLSHPRNNTITLQRNARHATMWQANGDIVDLHALIPVAFGAAESQAMGISNDGKITGFYMDAAGNHRAIVWDGNNVIDISQGVESKGLAINVNGQAVGYYQVIANEHVAFVYDLATDTRDSLINLMLADDLAARFLGVETHFSDALSINDSNAISGCGHNVDGLEIGFGFLTATNGADLDITITAQPNPVVAGNVASLSIPVRNRGPLHANDVMVTVNIPDNVTIIRAEHRIALSTNVLPDPIACNVSPNNVVQCSIPIIPAQFAAHVLIMVDTQDPGDVSVSASVVATENDPFVFNNSKQFTLGVDACFIATAAYGTSMHNDVQLLRHFRDDYLQPYSWGQSLVSFYYQTSPPIARFIAQRPWARSLTRSALRPIIFSIKHPIVGGMLLLVLIYLTRRFYIFRKSKKQMELAQHGQNGPSFSR